eukprot:CAMPEP_0171461736 /NCGR_PEP_ID=MMETSP0945-20130129/6061_1 /TAXON_ID=109269 /ORGANISM="Vaucheria litorea, Strain CCMP2940" /LENGTH=247 /DNA_ID=CAMNT_0011988135 /DNA_START=114 /DNA_END=857 /DNA_ORIENTATION=-
MSAGGGVTRREALETSAVTIAAAGMGLLASSSPVRADGPYYLPDLPYGYEALEPSIDAATMKFHHDKHHLAYVTNANKAVSGKEAVSILDLQKNAIKEGTRNAGGGHYNHSLFWTTLCSESKSGSPSSALSSAINSSFGSMEEMKTKFNTAAAGVFGSGWAWIGVTKDGKLDITTTPNQDNPLMEGAKCTPMIPILGLDVWEHAYYLKYQNRRPDYISAFWNVVNWPQVSKYYEEYASKGAGVPVKG